MVYPTLIAAIGDVAHPSWRARSVGVYRLWRDGGFAVGALLAGVLADSFSITAAIWAVAGLTALSGLVVLVRMYETHPVRRRSARRDLDAGQVAESRRERVAGDHPGMPVATRRSCRRPPNRRPRPGPARTPRLGATPATLGRRGGRTLVRTARTKRRDRARPAAATTGRRARGTTRGGEATTSEVNPRS